MQISIFPGNWCYDSNWLVRVNRGTRPRAGNKANFSTIIHSPVKFLVSIREVPHANSLYFSCLWHLRVRLQNAAADWQGRPLGSKFDALSQPASLLLHWGTLTQWHRSPHTQTSGLRKPLGLSFGLPQRRHDTLFAPVILSGILGISPSRSASFFRQSTSRSSPNASR